MGRMYESDEKDTTGASKLKKVPEEKKVVEQSKEEPKKEAPPENKEKELAKAVAAKQLLKEGTPPAKQEEKKQQAEAMEENTTKKGANLPEEANKEKATDAIVEEKAKEIAEDESIEADTVGEDPNDKSKEAEADDEKDDDEFMQEEEGDVKDAPFKTDKEREEEKDSGISSEFKKSLGYFGPKLAGMLIGGIVGSRKGKGGWAKGALIGGRAAHEGAEGFRNFQKDQQKTQMEQEEKRVDIDTKKEKLKQMQQGTDKAPEYQQVANYTTADGQSLRFDKGTGKYQTMDGKEYTGRLVGQGQGVELGKAKEAQLDKFESLPSVQATKQSLDRLDMMETKLGGASALAKGTIKIDIMKGIAQEVGNLSKDELAAAKIDLGLLGNIQAEAEEIFNKGLSKERTAELRKVIKLLKEKGRGRLQGDIKGFSQARGGFHGNKEGELEGRLSKSSQRYLNSPTKEQSQQQQAPQKTTLSNVPVGRKFKKGGKIYQMTAQGPKEI